ncbi:expressed unknown protein [Seminavis robusta]|uniref:Uncharacterized protein n=1 Tax=Seminavis robusta TaxID=568900 RepID=A0A9N8EAF1_9STRA|nr:expressed unknown protein [Seminavis robusta]|eukprot:Sro725_g193260.1 n/a (368) ;mRNA; r:4386-5683
MESKSSRDYLVIDYGQGKAAIEISPTSTLADVRNSVLEEFDDDMFPNQRNQQWGFWINGMRIAVKQEARKLAWNYLTDATVSIRSTNVKRALVAQPEDPATTAKKTKTVTFSVEDATASAAARAGPECSPPTEEGTPNETFRKMDVKESPPAKNFSLAFEKAKAKNNLLDEDATASAAVRAGPKCSPPTVEGAPNERSTTNTRCISADTAKKESTNLGNEIDSTDDVDVPITITIANSSSDEEMDVKESPPVKNPHINFRLAFEKANCCQEAKKLLKSSRPQTISGVYGGTGVLQWQVVVVEAEEEEQSISEEVAGKEEVAEATGFTPSHHISCSPPQQPKVGGGRQETSGERRRGRRQGTFGLQSN